MKILLISPLPPPAGGIATWTQDYIASGVMEENEISLVDTSKIEKVENNFVKYNVKNELIRTVRICKEIKKRLRESEYDIIHLNSACSPFGLLRDYMCVHFFKGVSVKYVVQYHCDVGFCVKSWLSKQVVKKICKQAEKVILLNHNSLQFVIGLGDFQCATIPNFVSKEVLMCTAEKKAVKKHISKIIFVGVLTSMKGIDIIWKMAERFPSIEFVCVGSTGNCVVDLLQRSNIVVKGMVDKNKVLGYMKEADVMLFPTHSEGFPNAVLEAMSVGLPLITTPVGAIPDMLEKKGGILVDVDDTEGFYEAIMTLADDVCLREQMGIWNQEKVKAHYAEEVVLTKLLKIYDSVMRSSQK